MATTQCIEQSPFTCNLCKLKFDFIDVMCFFISVYLLEGVYEKCQNILFLLLKRREK